MKNIDEVIDKYIEVKYNNMDTLKYLIRCKLLFIKTKLLNKISDLMETDLLNEMYDENIYFLDEVKLNKFYLKLIRKMLDKIIDLDCNEVDDEIFGILDYIFKIDNNVTELEKMRLENIVSIINGFGYCNSIEDNIEEYDDKIEELMLRLNNKE